MDPTRFDSLIRAIGNSEQRTPSRRGLLALLGVGIVASVTPVAMTEAKKKKRRKHKRKRRGGGGTLGLREICEQGGTETCQAGLKCDSPTTRHTCSSTVEGVDTWCCVPPGGRCTECDCCGDFYCAFDDDNNPSCQPNPEG